MLFMLLSTLADARDWREVTCEPDCVVAIGTEVGPAMSVHYPMPLAKVSIAIEMYHDDPGVGGHPVLRFRKGEKPVWIGSAPGADTVYYGLREGPTFPQINTAYVQGEKLYIKVYDEERWKTAVWDPRDDTLFLTEEGDEPAVKPLPFPWRKRTKA